MSVPVAAEAGSIWHPGIPVVCAVIVHAHTVNNAAVMSVLLQTQDATPRFASLSE